MMKNERERLEVIEKQNKEEEKRVKLIKARLKVEKENEKILKKIEELETSSTRTAADDKALKNLKDKIKSNTENIKLIRKQTEDTEELLSLSGDMVTTAEKARAVGYDIEKSQEKSKDIAIKLKKLKEGEAGLSGLELRRYREKSKILSKQLVEENIRLETNRETAKAVQGEEAMRKKMVGQAEELVKSAEQNLHMAKAFMKVMAANPYLAILAAIVSVIKAMEFLNNKTKEFQKATNASVVQAKELRNELVGAQVHAAALGYSASEAAGALSKEFGSLSDISGDTVMTMGKFEKGLNISMATSAKLMKTMKGVGAATDEAQINTMKYAAQLSIANDVAPAEVMESIAADTESFAKYGQDGGRNMIKAAVAAKKLGLEMSTLAKMSDSLLNFESSIAAEMEASMLIGKQLNYNKARELALSGDLEGATKNIMSQIGGAAEFQKMNVMQRQALADSIGVSVDELSKMASGKMELKAPDKTAEEKLEESMSTNTLTMMNLITVDNALKLAVIALTAAMIFNSLTSGKLGKMFGKFKGKFGKIASKLNPMNWGRTMNKAGTAFKGSSTGTISKVGTKLFGKSATVGKALKDAVNVGKATKALTTGAKILRGATSGIGGAVAGLTLDYGRSKLKDKDSNLGKSMGIGSAALTGAGIGATIGSVVPLVGTAVGGAVGGAIGGAIGVWTEYGDQMKSWWKGKSKSDEVQAKAKQEILAQEKKVVVDKAKVVKNEAAAQSAAMKAAREAKELKDKEIAAEKRAEIEKASKLSAKSGGTLAPVSAEQLEQQLESMRNRRAQFEERKTRLEEGGVMSNEKGSHETTEKLIAQNERNQAALIEALEKLNNTTQNLKQD